MKQIPSLIKSFIVIYCVFFTVMTIFTGILDIGVEQGRLFWMSAIVAAAGAITLPWLTQRGNHAL